MDQLIEISVLMRRSNMNSTEKIELIKFILICIVVMFTVFCFQQCEESKVRLERVRNEKEYFCYEE